MNADHARFADWDAAFVLGALSASERRAFEAHLQDCEVCRAAIVDTAPTIGLLARVSAERADSLLDASAGADGPDPARRRQLVARGVSHSQRRRTRTRRAWWTGGLAAAAAVATAVVIAVVLVIVPAGTPARVVALEPVVDIPLTATVELVDVAWGTRIEMICSYPEGDGDDSAAGWPYALFLTAADGTTSEVSSWIALPGATARIGAGTALEPDQIAAIEIRSLSSGRVLMRSELEPPGGEAP